MKESIYKRVTRLDLDGLVRVDPTTGCWHWMGRLNRKRYGLIDVPGADGKWSTKQAHRVVLATVLGMELPEHVHAMHLCRSRDCVAPTHLAAGTNAANVADREFARHGTGRHEGGVAA